jgi:hypothetical protein
MKVRLFDREFSHVGTVCGLDSSPNLTWVRDGDYLGVNVFTESYIDDIPACTKGIKVLWLIEPEAIHPWGYQYLRNGGHDNVDYVITFDKTIHDLVPDKAIWWCNGSWVYLSDWGISEKSKNVSICASTKTNTERQIFRQEIVRQLGKKCDLVCGTGRQHVANRVDIFKDYRYSIVVENSCADWYFSEKLIDCFAMGTVPIYCGCPSIAKYFDRNGIIPFQSLAELSAILGRLSHYDYDARRPAIVENHERAKKYVPVEEQLYRDFFKRFEAQA